MTLTDLEKIITPMDAQALANLLSRSQVLVSINEQETKIAKLIDARDLATKLANEEIAQEQAKLTMMQQDLKQLGG